MPLDAQGGRPQGRVAAQLLGYTGPVSADQLEALAKQGYLPDDLVGKTLAYASTMESDLRGYEGDKTAKALNALLAVMVRQP